MERLGAKLFYFNFMPCSLDIVCMYFFGGGGGSIDTGLTDAAHLNVVFIKSPLRQGSMTSVIFVMLSYMSVPAFFFFFFRIKLNLTLKNSWFGIGFDVLFFSHDWWGGKGFKCRVKHEAWTFTLPVKGVCEWGPGNSYVGNCEWSSAAAQRGLWECVAQRSNTKGSSIKR